MQTQNAYYFFKSALTPEQCDKIINLGNDEINRIKKAGGTAEATTGTGEFTAGRATATGSAGKTQ